MPIFASAAEKHLNHPDCNIIPSLGLRCSSVVHLLFILIKTPLYRQAARGSAGDPCFVVTLLAALAWARDGRLPVNDLPAGSHNFQHRSGAGDLDSVR